MSDRCIPADQLRVRRGVGVNVVGQDGEVPTAVLDLLLARGANRPHHPLADRAVLVGDIGQQELRTGWVQKRFHLMTGRITVCEGCGSSLSSATLWDRLCGPRSQLSF